MQSDHRPARLRCALSRAPPAETYAGALRVTLDDLCFEPSSDDDAAELDRLVRGLVPDAPASPENRVAVSLGAATASAPWAVRAVSVEAERAPRHCVVALEHGSALVALPTRDGAGASGAGSCASAGAAACSRGVCGWKVLFFRCNFKFGLAV